MGEVSPEAEPVQSLLLDSHDILLEPSASLENAGLVPGCTLQVIFGLRETDFHFEVLHDSELVEAVVSVTRCTLEGFADCCSDICHIPSSEAEFVHVLGEIKCVDVCTVLSCL